MNGLFSFRSYSISSLLLVVLSAAQPAQAMPPIAQIRLEVEDLLGNPIGSIPLGNDFQLAMFAHDLRDLVPSGFQGVFAAFADISFDTAKASRNGPASFGSFFSLLHTDVALGPALFDVGAATPSLIAPGPAEQLVARLPMHATALGTVTFTPSFDARLGHEILVYGNDNLIPFDQIAFVSAGAVIVPEPSGLLLAVIACGSFFVWRGRARLASSLRSAL